MYIWSEFSLRDLRNIPEKTTIFETGPYNIGKYNILYIIYFTLPNYLDEK